MRLAEKYGEVLGGRVLGEEIRAEVIRHIETGEEVVIDLDGVLAISPSFADEIFGKLPAAVGDQVQFVNVGDNLQTVAEMARAGRSAPDSE